MSTTITAMPWLEKPWQFLVNRVAQNNLPHAILMHAPTGFGKHILANELAKLLLCQSPSPQSACGECPSCLWFLHQHHVREQCHPDCYPITATSDSGVIKIDEIRHLIWQVGQTANQAGWKIAIIFKAHRLNTQAFNAFLKTLEEPTPNTLFLLLVDTLNLIPPTILSRTQRLSLALSEQVDIQTVLKWLAEDGKYNENQVKKALWLAGDAPILAREYLHNKTIEQYQLWLLDMEALQKNQLGSVAMAQKWKSLGENNTLWLSRLLHQRLTDSSVRECPWQYDKWLVFDQTLKIKQQGWLQYLNDISLLQTTYADWQACHQQQPLPIGF